MLVHPITQRTGNYSVKISLAFHKVWGNSEHGIDSHISSQAITKRFLIVVKITNYNITTLPDFRRGFLGFFGFDEGLDCSESSYILNTKKDKQTLHRFTTTAIPHPSLKKYCFYFKQTLDKNNFCLEMILGNFSRLMAKMEIWTCNLIYTLLSWHKSIYFLKNINKKEM